MNRIGSIALGIALVFAADAAAGDKSKETPKELRGVWVFDHVFVGGEPLDHGGELTDSTFALVNGKWIETYPNSDGTKRERKLRVEIDASKSPKQITIFETSIHGSLNWTVETEFAMPAIYEVMGNTLTICLSNERPKEFSSQNARLIIFKKQPSPNATKRSDVSPRRRPRELMSNLGRHFRR